MSLGIESASLPEVTQNVWGGRQFEERFTKLFGYFILGHAVDVGILYEEGTASGVKNLNLMTHLKGA